MSTPTTFVSAGTRSAITNGKKPNDVQDRRRWLPGETSVRRWLERLTADTPENEALYEPDTHLQLCVA
jgi:hypothetical protein